MKKLLYWLPRILALLLVGFFAVFALDVFNEPNWPLALFIHLLPSLTLLVLTLLAWKFEHFGGLIFVLAGLGMYLFFHSWWIASPAFIIAIGFIVSNYSRRA